MTSPLLALFVRSLSQDSYGKATYWTRAGLCGLTILLLALMAKNPGWPRAPGLYFFISIVSLQMVAISAVGLSYFGSAIAEEKEEQTLGLLRMTDLNSLSILLGKSTSRLCGALLLLVAAFPFTIIAVTLGGVSLGQIMATYCTIAAYTFLLCNVALLGSVLARHTAGAATFSAVVIGVLVGAGPFLQAANGQLLKFGVKSSLGSIGKTLWQNTPIARIEEILTTGFSGSPAGWQVGSNLALGAGCFFLAWAAFGRFCDRAPDESGRATGTSMRFLGLRIRRPPRPGVHAIAWKDYYFLCGGNPGLTLRVFGYLVGPVVTIGILSFGGPATISDVLRMFDTWITYIFYIDTGAMAARLFRSELNDQTLSALAILPSTIRRIAYRKARILLLVSAPGAVCTTGVGALLVWFTYGGTPSQAQMILGAASYVSATVLFVHAVTWASLTTKRGALPLGIVFVVVLNVLVMIVGSSLGTYFSLKWGYSRFFDLWFAFILGTFVNTSFALYMHFRSLRRLEDLAGEG